MNKPLILSGLENDVFYPVFRPLDMFLAISAKMSDCLVKIFHVFLTLAKLCEYTGFYRRAKCLKPSFRLPEAIFPLPAFVRLSCFL